MRTTSKLLINEPPLQVLPTLAKLIGLNCAIMLQQVHYWTDGYRRAEKELPADERRHYIDGRYWVWNDYDEWKRSNFPFWSMRTIQRTILDLEEKMLIVGTQDGFDRTKRYAVDYDALEKLLGIDENEPPDVGDDDSPIVPTWHDATRQPVTVEGQSGTIDRAKAPSEGVTTWHDVHIATEKRTKEGGENNTDPSPHNPETSDADPDMGGMQPAQVWQAALGEIRLQMTKPTFETWVEPTRVLGYQDGEFVIGVPSAFSRDWLERKLLTSIKRSLCGIVGHTIAVTFVVIGDKSHIKPRDLIPQD